MRAWQPPLNLTGVKTPCCGRSRTPVPPWLTGHVLGQRYMEGTRLVRGKAQYRREPGFIAVDNVGLS